MIKHNSTNRKTCFSIWLCLLLAIPMANASDIFHYSFSGTIIDLKTNSIRLNDGYYTYSPTVKVFKENGVKAFTSDLKIGDYVEITIQVMDKKRRVDTIRYLPKPNTGKKRPS